MTSDLDIYRSANLLIKQHGERVRPHLRGHAGVQASGMWRLAGYFGLREKSGTALVREGRVAGRRGPTAAATSLNNLAAL